MIRAARDRIRNTVGQRRKRIAAAYDWARQQYAACKSDAMVARLFEEMMRKVEGGK